MTIHEMVNFLSTRLKEDMEMNGKFPFDSKTPQHKRRYPRHMRDVALKQNVTYLLSPDMHYFELGNASAEQNTPHYHILEDAKIIRNPYKGTKKSLGSQRVIGRKSQRDYGQLVYIANQKGDYSVVQEYRQNMTRNYDGRIGAKTQPREYRKRQKVSDINKRNYRYNKHYQYIERILFDVTKGLATELNSMSVPVKLKFGQTDLVGNQEIAGYLNKDYQIQKLALTNASFNLEGID